MLYQCLSVLLRNCNVFLFSFCCCYSNPDVDVRIVMWMPVQRLLSIYAGNAQKARECLAKIESTFPPCTVKIIEGGGLYTRAVAQLTTVTEID